MLILIVIFIANELWQMLCSIKTDKKQCDSITTVMFCDKILVICNNRLYRNDLMMTAFSRKNMPSFLPHPLPFSLPVFLPSFWSYPK